MQSERQPAGATAPNDTRTRVKYVRRLGQVTQLTPEQRDRLGPVEARYVFRANDYYLGLIDWDDPEDPIRQLIIPREEELSEWGTLDASNEESVTVARGVQHKYTDTVLLLCNEVCGAYCRYCFRKRLFMDDNDEVTHDITEGLRYIADHPEVTNVLLTGGDPLLMSTRRLVEIFEALRAIPHVRIIRLGSKMPAFDPYRVLNDPDLRAAFRTYSTPQQRLYLMAHFDHPRELTDVAIRGVDACIRNGVICVNQCPLIKGINDDPAVLAEMYATLSYIGCTPYYLFQGRPTGGQRAVRDPDRRGVEHFPAGADARVRAGAERALLHVARDGQGGDHEHRRRAHVSALPPGQMRRRRRPLLHLSPGRQRLLARPARGRRPRARARVAPSGSERRAPVSIVAVMSSSHDLATTRMSHQPMIGIGWLSGRGLQGWQRSWP